MLLLQGLNMATNAFLSWSLGKQYNVTLLGLSEMPKPGTAPARIFEACITHDLSCVPVRRRGHVVILVATSVWSGCAHGTYRLLFVLHAGTQLNLDISSLLGPIFFCWLVQQLLPVMLVTLVYEKQQG